MNKPNFEVSIINGKISKWDICFKMTTLILSSLEIYDKLELFTPDISKRASEIKQLSYDFYYNNFKLNYNENLGIDFINDLIDIFEKFTENYEEVLKLYAK